MSKNETIGKFAAALREGNIPLVNDQSLFFPAYEGASTGNHGSIFHAANDELWDGQFLNEPLTTYAVGVPSEGDLQQNIERLFPSVPVSRRFSYFVHDNMLDFAALSNDTDKREMFGEFAEIKQTGTQAEGATDNKGLVMILENDMGGEDPTVQQRAVQRVRDILNRTELIRGIGLLNAAATANGAAGTATYNWGPGNTTSRDPDMNVLEDIDASGDLRGIDSNTILIGKSALIKRKKAYRSLGTDSGHADSKMGLGEIADFVGVDRIIPVNNRQALKDGTKGKIVGDTFYSYYALNGAMPQDPSNIKRFVSGPGYRVYVIPKLKRTLVCVEYHSRIIVTSKLGIKKHVVTWT